MKIHNPLLVRGLVMREAGLVVLEKQTSFCQLPYGASAFHPDALKD